MRRITDELREVLHALSHKSWQQLALYFGLYALPLIVFVKLADEVRERETLPFDVAVLESVHRLSAPGLDTVVTSVTDFGYVWWVGGITLVVCAALIYWRRYRDAAIVLVGVAGSAVLNLILKALFQRDRPELWARLVTENSHSFPSGHAMASMSLAAVIIVVLWPTRWRWLAVSGGALYVLVIGFTRLYLGVHYPTDIVAGWVMAAAWVVIVAAVVRRWQIHKKSP